VKIVREAIAGTLESNDVFVRVSPADKGLNIQVQSIVLGQFGAQIEQAARQTAQMLGVQNAVLSLDDRGAIDCTIRARVETALLRGAEVQA
jgi:citrate lyase subunit gamma (acyl carrier protein)